jgi:hypothetical protein
LNRLKKEENLFESFHDKKLTRWSTINAMYCVCEQAITGLKGVTSGRIPKALCSATQYLDCDLTNPTYTSRMCNIITRKKRSVRSGIKIAKAKEKHVREAQRIMKLINTPMEKAHVINVSLCLRCHCNTLLF